MNDLRISVLFLLFCALANAQQTGDPNRDYTINGIGSGGTSYVASTLGVPGTMSNSYATMDANMPVVWGIATGGTIGWITGAVNSVDIGPAGLTFLGNGTDPSSPLNAFFFTDQFGAFNINLNAPASLAGSAPYFAMAHVSPISIDGFYVSQTHVTSFALDPNLSPGNAVCNPAGTPQSLPDDGSVNVGLGGWSFMYYGVAYTDLWIGSNGFITFGAGSSDFTESVPELLMNEPRIAMWWDDLNPSNGTQGTITFFTDNASMAEVCFTGVPEFVSTGANDFKCTITNAGFITLDYGVMSSADSIVGVSPGGNIDPVGLPINLSVGPNSIPPGMAAYEQLTSNDLQGFQVNFLLDANGSPITQL